MKTTTNSVFKNITFIGNEYSANYKPRLEKIINTPEAVFTIELYKSSGFGIWFRILRLLNERRTHDFIINTFAENQIYFENDTSNSTTMQLSSINDIKEMFKDAKIYSKYTRPKDTTYVHDESTLISIEDLIKEWNSLK